LPKTNGRIGALPPLDGNTGDDDQELSSKRARSLQNKSINALSPAPEVRDINLTKVDTRAISPTEDIKETIGDNSTVVVDKQNPT
jgi:hypothetical protein